MNLFLVCFTAGACFLLGFLLFFHPLQQNVKANRWLGVFACILGTAFGSTYMLQTQLDALYPLLFKCLSCLQYLLGPGIFISILYFVNPPKAFRLQDSLHFLPFTIYVAIEFIWIFDQKTIAAMPLFAITENVSFLVRDLLPLITLGYLINSYIILRKHQANIKLIASNISHINLGWLKQLLFILALSLLFWINDAFLGLSFLTTLMPFVYAVSVFLLAYFSIKQKTVFDFREKDMKAISEVLAGVNTPAQEMPREQSDIRELPLTQVPATRKERGKQQRLNPEQVAALSARLAILMENDKLYLDNALSLPAVAEKLGISIHESSYLINAVTKDNFYMYINKYRVEEAKRLLTSARMEELNILGIAFASGFNSKTTFNTTFKKIVGISPSGYVKTHKKG
jgi:AraC-like DNA-binding protein